MSNIERKFYGVGYLGEGDYTYRINGKETLTHIMWRDMLKRCYSEKYHEKKPSYIGCTVDKEWHNFQVFAKWFDENYYEVEGQTINLDKDILNKGNKIYSSNNCVFVPQNINTLFISQKSKRGKYPIGVSYDKEKSKYRADCRNNGKNVNLGRYSSVEDAFNSYKVHKEKLIKEIAEQYKEHIPSTLYNAMILYKVDIND